MRFYNSNNEITETPKHNETRYPYRDIVYDCEGDFDPNECAPCLKTVSIVDNKD